MNLLTVPLTAHTTQFFLISKVLLCYALLTNVKSPLSVLLTVLQCYLRAVLVMNSAPDEGGEVRA